MGIVRVLILDVAFWNLEVWESECGGSGNWVGTMGFRFGGNVGP